MTGLGDIKMDDFVIGQEATIVKSFTEKDVELFSKLSNDNNPVHLNEEYDKNTIFNDRIAYGKYYKAVCSGTMHSWQN